MRVLDIRIQSDMKEEAFGPEVRKIEENRTNDTINFTGSTFTRDQLARIFRAVSRTPITAVIFDKCSGNVSAAKQLAIALKESKSIRRFEMKHHGFTDEAMEYIHAGMSNAGSLESTVVVAPPGLPSQLNVQAAQAAAAISMLPPTPSPASQKAAAPPPVKLARTPYPTFALTTEEFTKTKNPFYDKEASSDKKDETVLRIYETGDTRNRGGDGIGQLEFEYNRQTNIQHKKNDKSYEQQYKSFDDYIHQLYPNHYELLKKHFSQGTSGSILAPILNILGGKASGRFLLRQPTEHERDLDLYLDSKDGKIYFRAFASRYPVTNLETNEKDTNRYFFRASVEILYVLEEKGFKPISFSTNSQILRDVYLGENFNEDTLTFAMGMIVQFRVGDEKVAAEEPLISVLKKLHEQAWMQRVYDVMVDNSIALEKKKKQLEKELKHFQALSDLAITKWKESTAELYADLKMKDPHPDPDYSRNVRAMAEKKRTGQKEYLEKWKQKVDDAEKDLEKRKGDPGAAHLRTTIRNDRQAISILNNDLRCREAILNHEHDSKTLNFAEQIALLRPDQGFVCDLYEVAEQESRLCMLFDAEREIRGEKLSATARSIADDLKKELNTEWQRRVESIIRKNIQRIPSVRNELVNAEFKRFQTLSHLAREIFSTEEKALQLSRMASVSASMRSRLSAAPPVVHPLEAAIHNIRFRVLNIFRNYSYHNSVSRVCSEIRTLLAVDASDSNLQLTPDARRAFKIYVDDIVRRVDQEVASSRGQLVKEVELVRHPENEFPSPPAHKVEREQSLLAKVEMVKPDADGEPQSASVSRASRSPSLSVTRNALWSSVAAGQDAPSSNSGVNGDALSPSSGASASNGVTEESQVGAAKTSNNLG
jgi:hypothetical protein